MKEQLESLLPVALEAVQEQQEKILQRQPAAAVKVLRPKRLEEARAFADATIFPAMSISNVSILLLLTRLTVILQRLSTNCMFS